MSFAIQSEFPPLHKDASGVFRIGKSRVLLEMVIRAFHDGATPEIIIQRYPTLDLKDVYSVIAYYLHHRKEIDEYLTHREHAAWEVRQRIENYQTDMGDIRIRLLSRKTV